MENQITKEEIIAEGWYQPYADDNEYFMKNIQPGNEFSRYYIIIYKDEDSMYIGDEESEVNYKGDIPTLESFQTICKLLRINGE